MSRAPTEALPSDFLKKIEAMRTELVAEYEKDTAMGINFHEAKLTMVQNFEKFVREYKPPIANAIFEDSETNKELAGLFHLDFSTRILSEQSIIEHKEKIKKGIDSLIARIDSLHSNELDSLGKTEFSRLKDLNDFILSYDKIASHLAIESAQKNIDTAFEKILPETVVTQIKSRILARSEVLNRQLDDKLANLKATGASICPATMFGGTVAASKEPGEDFKENVGDSETNHKSAFRQPVI